MPLTEEDYKFIIDVFSRIDALPLGNIKCMACPDFDICSPERPKTRCKDLERTLRLDYETLKKTNSKHNKS